MRRWVSGSESPPNLEIRAAVKGENGRIDAALDALVSIPSEPVWTELDKGRVVYVWDEDREVGEGLPLG